MLFDFDAFRASFEARDVQRWITFYADDSEWLEYRDDGKPPRAPHVMRGRAEIEEFLRDVAASDLSVALENEVVGEIRAAFTTVVTFGDGRRILENTIIDYPGGLITRTMEVEAWDP